VVPEGTAGLTGVQDPVVAVVGMHRGGTSATAGLLIRLGLTGPQGNDLIPASRSNQAGHWESYRVVRCNARLLWALGGTAFGPPEITLDWEKAARNYPQIRDIALRWFADAHVGGPMMVKDPRLCMTLPFWRDVLPAPLAVVFVLRNPLSVARSLRARDGVPMMLGLAAWDRSMRSAALVLEGLPTLLVDYDDMMVDPDVTTKEVVRFLEHVGVEVAPDLKEAAAGHLDSALHHQKPEDDEYHDMALVQRRIFETLLDHKGFHATWEPPPAFPAAPLWVEDALRLRRQHKATVRELKALRRSRSNRIHGELARLTRAWAALRSHGKDALSHGHRHHGV
jgi:hypothetical protein